MASGYGPGWGPPYGPQYRAPPPNQPMPPYGYGGGPWGPYPMQGMPYGPYGGYGPPSGPPPGPPMSSPFENNEEPEGPPGEDPAPPGEDGGGPPSGPSQPLMDTTPATTINGVSFNIAGQRIPQSFNPYPSPVRHPPPGLGSSKKKKKKNKGGAPAFPPPQGMYGVPPPPMPPQTPPQSQQPLTGNANAQTLSTPGAAGPSGAGIAAGANNWPPSLKEYVNRCFSKCVTDMDKDQVEIILKGKITQAASSGTLWTKDWDSEPLPATLSKDMEKKFEINRPATGIRPGFNVFKGRRPNSPPRRRRRVSSSSSSSNESSTSRSSRSSKKRNASPDYGKNPNCIPLGGNVKQKKLGKGKKAKLLLTKGGQAKVPYLYTKAGKSSMTLDEDLATRERKQRRAARFDNPGVRGPRAAKGINLATLNDHLTNDNFEENSLHWESLHIVGTCQDLEKRYLRLTTAPEAHMVRPVEVLKRSLSMVISHWKSKQDYHYACDQMKSIRQDLTVQGVRDAFTVKVYETHARIALEKGDFTEFNQCQSQLKMLYTDVEDARQNRLEFTSYRILYYMYTNETMDLTSALAELSKEEKSDPCIAFALKLRSAWSLQNYKKFFQLYAEAPKMSGYLIDWFIERVRKAALRIIIKAYRVSVPVSQVQGLMCLESTEDWDKFVNDFQLKYTDASKSALDCKTSMACLAAIK